MRIFKQKLNYFVLYLKFISIFNAFRKSSSVIANVWYERVYFVESVKCIFLGVSEINQQ